MRDSQLMQRREQDVELRTRPEGEYAGGGPGVNVGQQELVALAGNGVIRRALPPGDRSLDARKVYVRQGRHPEAAGGVAQRAGQIRP